MKNPTFQTSTHTPGATVMLLTPIFLVLLLLSTISGWLLLGGLYLGSWLVLREFFLPTSVELSDEDLTTKSGTLVKESVAYKEIVGVGRTHDHFDRFIVISYTKRLLLCLGNAQQEELFLQELQARRDECDARR